MKFSCLLRKTQLLLLLPAVMWLFTNALINTHYHYLSDGQVISHAHPYNKSENRGTPFESHKHTRIQLIFLSILDKTDAVVTCVFVLSLLSSDLPKCSIFIPAEAPAKVYYQVYNYHAPPVLQFNQRFV